MIRKFQNEGHLGHAQASTTMNIYAHALKENDRTASNALENMLCKTGA